MEKKMEKQKKKKKKPKVSNTERNGNSTQKISFQEND